MRIEPIEDEPEIEVVPEAAEMRTEEETGMEMDQPGPLLDITPVTEDTARPPQDPPNPPLPLPDLWPSLSDALSSRSPDRIVQALIDLSNQPNDDPDRLTPRNAALFAASLRFLLLTLPRTHDQDTPEYHEIVRALASTLRLHALDLDSALYILTTRFLSGSAPDLTESDESDGSASTTVRTAWQDVADAFVLRTRRSTTAAAAPTLPPRLAHHLQHATAVTAAPKHLLWMLPLAVFLPYAFRLLTRLERSEGIEFLSPTAPHAVSSFDRIYLGAALATCRGAISGLISDPLESDQDQVDAIYACQAAAEQLSTIIREVVSPSGGVDTSHQCHVAFQSVLAILNEPDLEPLLLCAAPHMSIRGHCIQDAVTAVGDSVWSYLQLFSTAVSTDQFRGGCVALLSTLAAEAHRLYSNTVVAAVTAVGGGGAVTAGVAGKRGATGGVRNPVLEMGKAVFLRPETLPWALLGTFANALNRPDGKLAKKDISACLSALRCLFLPPLPPAPPTTRGHPDVTARPDPDSRYRDQLRASACLMECMGAGLGEGMNLPVDVRAELIEEIRRTVQNATALFSTLFLSTPPAINLDKSPRRSDSESDFRVRISKCVSDTLAAVLRVAEGESAVRCRRSAVQCIVVMLLGCVKKGSDDEFYTIKALGKRCVDRDAVVRSTAVRALQSLQIDTVMECLAADEWGKIFEVGLLDESADTRACVERLFIDYLTSGFDQVWVLLEQLGLFTPTFVLSRPQSDAPHEPPPPANAKKGGRGQGGGGGGGGGLPFRGAAKPEAIAQMGARAAVFWEIDRILRQHVSAQWFQSLGKWLAKKQA